MRCTPSHLVRSILVFVVAGVTPCTIGDGRGLAFITNSVKTPILSFWFIQLSFYKWYAIALLALFVLQTILIAKLLLERKRHWRVSSRLNESEERFSKAFRGNPQPMSITTIEEVDMST
jgi:hypothetical protein